MFENFGTAFIIGAVIGTFCSRVIENLTAEDAA